MLVYTRDNRLICSDCRMQQKFLRPQCSFCGRIFSNYENILIQNEYLTSSEFCDIINIEKKEEVQINGTD